MTYYGAKELAESFRTVAAQHIQIAQDIPEEKYGFRATPETQTVAEELAHVACSTLWQVQAHAVEKKTFITFEDFGIYMGRMAPKLEKALDNQGAILDALQKHGEEFARFLESTERRAAGGARQLPAADSAIEQDTLRDAARRQRTRDASSRQADARRAAARHRAAPDARATAAAGQHACGRS